VAVSMLCQNRSFPVMDVGSIFPGGKSVFFKGRPTVMKFYFTNSKLREKHLSTKKIIRVYQISKSRGSQGPLVPLPTPLFALPFVDTRLEHTCELYRPKHELLKSAASKFIDMLISFVKPQPRSERT